MVNAIVDDLNRGRESEVIVKLDYEKTLNSIDWKFLYYIMGRLRFNNK